MGGLESQPEKMNGEFSGLPAPWRLNGFSGVFSNEKGGPEGDPVRLVLKRPGRHILFLFDVRCLPETLQGTLVRALLQRFKWKALSACLALKTFNSVRPVLFLLATRLLLFYCCCGAAVKALLLFLPNICIVCANVFVFLKNRMLRFCDCV